MDLVVAIDTPAADVPSELKEAVAQVVVERYEVGAIDWEDVWDRVDGYLLEDGRLVDIVALTGPAITCMQSYARSARDH